MERVFETEQGNIVYWINEIREDRLSLIFLPGLTADHRLFDRQVACFRERYNVFVWDAPGHGASRPFAFTFSLADKARWLRDILDKEGINNRVLIGQSMGGYVAQSYMQQFPGELKGFVSIDSCPLQKSYTTGVESWLLRHIGPVYRVYPWKLLCSAGSNGCAQTEYGRQLMREMMSAYSKEDYCALAAHGYRILGEAIEEDLPYRIDCPALLICGEMDRAGSAKRYNRQWQRRTGLPMQWLPGAGHNSNTDQPEKVNALIEGFLQNL